MHSSNIWLPISLFCHSAYWSDLLTEGVQPFADMLYEERKLLYHQISFNRERGDNIRFTMLVEKHNAEETAMYSDYYFKLYFSKTQHTSKLPEIHHNGILMDFPTNSILYGLFAQNQQSDQLYNDPALQQELSALLIEAVNNQLITEETILMLAFHLYLSLQAAIVQFSEISLDDLLHAPRPFISEIDGSFKIQGILEEFEHNKARLFDIAYDILKQDEGLPDWCRKWRQLCENKMISLTGKTTSSLISFYNQMAYFIDTHLGLGDYMKFLAFHFIKKSTNLY